MVIQPKGLQHLSQFGLINNTENKDNTNLFEIYETIKESVLELASRKEVEEELTKVVIRVLNSLMQKGKMSRYVLSLVNTTIKSNLEVLLNNAEKYKVDITLYQNLYNMEKMKNQLEDKNCQIFRQQKNN